MIAHARLAVGTNVATLILCSLVIAGLGYARFAGAAEEKKRTKIDFEDELVEGQLKKPELFYLLQKKQFNFKRLIKLREDFIPEMRRDGEEVRRHRSK